MKNKTKPKIKNESVTRKEYNYSIGNVSLGFTLRQDTNTELECFRELLLQSLTDVETDLAKFN